MTSSHLVIREKQKFSVNLMDYRKIIIDHNDYGIFVWDSDDCAPGAALHSGLLNDEIISSGRFILEKIFRLDHVEDKDRRM